MQSQGNANHFISIGLNFGILIAAIWPTWIVLSGLERNHEGDDVHGKAASVEDEHRHSGEQGSDKVRI
jgi:hypothetical protein